MNKLTEQDARIVAANEKAVRLARLQDAFITQIKTDLIEGDETAIDELFYNILKVEGAVNLLIDYLPEAQQTKFLDLVGQHAAEL